ncbi:MAG TPA: ABC transporter permease [Bryobacteraceae bacterium]|nr:ABC transporter permease [Bryobacteraceae bacterium]
MDWLEQFLQDARYAIRGMGRSPAFFAVAVLTLALGIGANTAIFSVVYGVWLAPAKYAQPERLVDISMRQLSGNRFMGGTSFPNLADWRSQAKTIKAFGLHRYIRAVNVTGSEGAEEVVAHGVSANLFPLLGVSPALGRPIDPEADRASGPREALISYAWWMRRYGGDPEVIGRPVEVDGGQYTVAGVMPQGFAFPPMGSASYRPALWMSLNVPPEQERARDAHSFYTIARLKDGSSIAEARAEMDTIVARLASAYASDDGGWGVQVSRLNEGRALEQFRPALLLIMGAASFVLLIACANIANLLVARACGREREMTVRRALGATRFRLVRQVLTESGILAMTGGVAGVLLAYGALPALKSTLPAGMPRADEIGINSAVLLFGSGISLATGLLFGALPAVRPRGLASGARALVISEIALALVLVAGAGLLLESFRRVASVDLGFRKEHVLTVRLQLTKARYSGAARVAAFRDELLRKARAVPGVQYAGTVSSLPMGTIMQATDFEIEGRPETARSKPFADYASVSRDYLRAMGIRLVRGRYFESSDVAGSSPVALISESLARQFWPRGAAVGNRMRFHDTWFTVAGVVSEVRQYSPEQGSRGGTVYALNEQLPIAEQGYSIAHLMVLVARTAGDPASLAAALRRAVADIDSGQPVADVSTMEQVVWRTEAARRLNTLLVVLFAALAIVLAAVGIFGLTSYAVDRRTREIGIRMAVGAAPRSILALVARETAVLAVTGAAIGMAGTAAASRVLARFLFGVGAMDPQVVTAAAALLVGIVVASAMIPARRAMRVDPMVALRHD